MTTARAETYPEPPVGRTVRIRAELDPIEGFVTVRCGDSLLAKFRHDDRPFRDWQQSLGNQLSPTKPTTREFKLERRSDAMAGQLADLAGATEISQLVTGVQADATATIFLRVELPQRELDIVPWELLGPAVGSAVARKVCVYRSVSRGKRRRVTGPDPPQRVLLAASSPISGQSTAFSPECESIQRELSLMQLAGLVDAEHYWPDVDAPQLAGAMRDPTRLVHFAAQGKAGRVDLRQGIHPVSYASEPFAEFFTREPVPATVCLSVCESVPAPEPVTGSPEPPGLARALAQGGVTGVIGMYGAITPAAALEFFTALYRELGRCADLASAYAAAVDALRHSDYPDGGLWSVPVLYSSENVIPFPRGYGDPAGAYRTIADEVNQLRSELSAMQPEAGWSAITWQRETMVLRVEADERRLLLQQLIDLVQHEVRAGSRWARDVSRAADEGLDALNAVVARAASPRPGVEATENFTESKSRLTETLDELFQAISARIQFS